MSTRAQSTVIGVVLLFGIAIIAFSSYQAVQIPDQNAQIEYQHFQDVQNDLIAVRSGISTAGQVDVPQYRTVTLGTAYPTRILGINPPPPAGTLATSEPYNITITDENNNRTNVSTRFLTYQNGYNQLDVGTIRYENSVLYLDERSSSAEIVILEDQNFLVGGNSLRITALQNDFTRSTTGRVTIELFPVDGAVDNLNDLSGNVTITLPTQLNESEYWGASALADYENGMNGITYNGVEDTAEPDLYRVNLTVDNPDHLKINTVGVQEAPDDPGAVRQGVGLQNPPGPADSPEFYPTNSTVNQGQLDDFENMQSDSIDVAQMSSEGNTPFDIDIITEDLPADEYTLEIRIGGGSTQQGDGVDITVTDETGSQVGSETSNTNNPEGLVEIPIDGTVSGELTVTYDAASQNNKLDIEYQRFVLSE